MSNRFKPKFNIKKGDSVVVITGDDKDPKKARKVLEVLAHPSPAPLPARFTACAMAAGVLAVYRSLV